MDTTQNGNPFDPENVQRIEWDCDREGWWHDVSWKDGPLPEPKTVMVLASDYDKLLSLYRALQPQMTISEVYGTVEIK